MVSPGFAKSVGAGVTLYVYPPTVCGVKLYVVPPDPGETVSELAPVPEKDPGFIDHVALPKFELIFIVAVVLTVTVALPLPLPPGPVHVIVYVVVEPGVTD